ncbi:TerD family protein [Actinomadura flavalba]|uniref:TerD family protein n=1 Tax=Actinomadura flavalba TaxID=1120938 RepID=UPI000381291E|nr:TerD family protein [Actinomadura flavalba]
MRNERAWAIVDVETSGLRAAQHRVLSVAVVTAAADGTPQGEYATLLDPGCDPGPVHIHGLTPARLRGAPRFEQVAGRVAELLAGRVLVAHNAHFDHGFLAQEFARAGTNWPVAERLCTLALHRRLAPPTPDLRLGTLAAHYGVAHDRAHDALADARALAGIFRYSLREAGRLGLDLPVVPCAPPGPRYAPPIPKVHCPYRGPGRYVPGGPLVQGMKVAVTGETALPRPELCAAGSAAGLDMMQAVSGRTSALVVGHGAGGFAKARRAVDEGVPVLGEAEFLRLLADVRPGALKEAGVDVPAPRRAIAPVRGRAAGPLGGRRVLVLGGTHAEAAGARARVAELGGAAAVNLSASVTDVVALRGGREDRRFPRVQALDLPVHTENWLTRPADDPRTPRPSPARGDVPRGPRPEPSPERDVGGVGAPVVLVRGAVIDLPDDGRWTLSASWEARDGCEVDVVAFALDGAGRVAGDDDFVFYGAPEGPDGAVRLVVDGPAEQSVALDLAALPADVRTVTVAAAVDGGTFGGLGAVRVVVAPGAAAAPHAEATLDAATSERALLLAEVYRRGPVWRLRAVGQGFDHGLAGLATAFGVEVEDA